MIFEALPSDPTMGENKYGVRIGRPCSGTSDAYADAIGIVTFVPGAIVVSLSHERGSYIAEIGPDGLLHNVRNGEGVRGELVNAVDRVCAAVERAAEISES